MKFIKGKYYMAVTKNGVFYRGRYLKKEGFYTIFSNATDFLKNRNKWNKNVCNIVHIKNIEHAVIVDEDRNDIPINLWVS